VKEINGEHVDCLSSLRLPVPVMLRSTANEMVGGIKHLKQESLITGKDATAILRKDGFNPSMYQAYRTKEKIKIRIAERKESSYSKFVQTNKNLVRENPDTVVLEMFSFEGEKRNVRFTFSYVINLLIIFVFVKIRGRYDSRGLILS
jgi:hypothetical protein